MVVKAHARRCSASIEPSPLSIRDGHLKHCFSHGQLGKGERGYKLRTPTNLPNFGGQGMYGDKVHAAVLASGDSETGITIHLVDEAYDHGQILTQTRVPVLSGDDVSTLAARVLKREHVFLVETLKEVVAGTLKLPK